MKRTAVTMLVVSLFAFSLFAGESKARCMSLEHVRGAWQMSIRCDQGVGTIALVDTAGKNVYRGDGIFSSWSQEQLGSMYQSLVPQDNSSSIEVLQLG